MAETDLSRRSMMACVPVAALLAPAVILETPQPDPIFAAIEKHRLADAKWRVACDACDDDHSEAAKAEHEAAILASREACDLLIETAPTTLAGIIAVIAWLAEYDEGCLPDTCGAWLEAFAKSQAFVELKGGFHV